MSKIRGKRLARPVYNSESEMWNVEVKVNETEWDKVVITASEAYTDLIGYETMEEAIKFIKLRGDKLELYTEKGLIHKFSPILNVLKDHKGAKFCLGLCCSDCPLFKSEAGEPNICMKLNELANEMTKLSKDGVNND